MKKQPSKIKVSPALCFIQYNLSMQSLQNLR